jgi:hypothetical protein
MVGLDYDIASYILYRSPQYLPEPIMPSKDGVTSYIFCPSADRPRTSAEHGNKVA